MKYLAKLIVFISVIICGLIVTLLSNLFFVLIRSLIWEFKFPSNEDLKKWNEYEDGDLFNERRSTYYKNFLFYLINYKPYYKPYK